MLQVLNFGTFMSDGTRNVTSYVHTYIHTYIHTYVHVNVEIVLFLSETVHRYIGPGSITTIF
jgi:hypothetical protein